MARWEIMDTIIDRVAEQTAIPEAVNLVRDESSSGLLSLIQGFPGATSQGRLSAVFQVEDVVNRRLNELARYPRHTVDFIGRPEPARVQ
jgi:hypothetical protein